jgi:hypothetical protein
MRSAAVSGLLRSAPGAVIASRAWTAFAGGSASWYFRLPEITDPSKPPVYKDLNFRFRPKRPLSDHYAIDMMAGCIPI